MSNMDRIDLRPLEFGGGRAILDEMMRNDPKVNEVEAKLMGLMADNPSLFFSASVKSLGKIPLTMRQIFFRLMDRAPQDLVDAYGSLGKDVRRFGTWDGIFVSRTAIDEKPAERLEHKPTLTSEEVKAAYEKMGRADHIKVFGLDDQFVPNLFDVVSTPRDQRFAYKMAFDLMNGIAVFNRGGTQEIVERGIEAAYRMAFGGNVPHFANVEVQQHSGSSSIHVEMQRQHPALAPFEPFVHDEVAIDHSGRIITNIDPEKRPADKPFIFTYRVGAEKAISPPARPMHLVEIPYPKGVKAHEFANVLHMASGDASNFGTKLFCEGIGGVIELTDANPTDLELVAAHLETGEAAALMAVGANATSSVASVYTSVILASAPVR